MHRCSGILMSAVFLISLGGCSGGGLVQRNGIGSVGDVQFVIYQTSVWTMPQPPLYPLQAPSRIEERAAIQAFYDAMNHPTGALQLAVAPNCRLGFVTRDGRVAMFAVGGAGSDCESCRADLTRALKMAFTGSKAKPGRTAIPPGALARLTYHPGKGSRSISLGPGTRLAGMEKQWRYLLETYDPLSLRGNVRASQKELRKFLAWAPTYVEARLSKPILFEAIVVPPDLDPKWPPPHGDNRARLEKVEYDTIYVARLPGTRSKFVRFGFVSSRTGDCVLTDAVYPKVIVRREGNRGIYGPDLFDEVVSALTK